MTKKLEELFDLPQDDDTIEPVEQEDEPITEESKELITQEAMNNLEKIDAALPAIKGLEASDKEMDDIAKEAMDSYKDLVDLGMNIEARVASEILSSASQFLGHAITAKNAKINKKLRMVELQLRRARLDLDERKLEASKKGGDGEEEEGEGKMLDRNELLAEVLKAAQEGAKKD
jgi:hypothetical protein